MFSSGAAAIDRLLPGGGLRHGMLVEWLGESGHAEASQILCRESRVRRARTANYPHHSSPDYCSAVTLSLLAARSVSRRRRAGGDRSAANFLSAGGRGLGHRSGSAHRRSPAERARRIVGGGAVAALAGGGGDVGERSSGSIAARFAGCNWRPKPAGRWGCLLRPASARGQPSWADVRLEVSPLSVVRSPLHSNHGPRTTDHGRRVQVRLLHCRGGRAGGSAMLEIDDAAYIVREVSSTHDTHPLPVVAELADPAGRSLLGPSLKAGRWRGY